MNCHCIYYHCNFIYGNIPEPSLFNDLFVDCFVDRFLHNTIARTTLPTLTNRTTSPTAAPAMAPGPRPELLSLSIKPSVPALSKSSVVSVLSFDNDPVVEVVSVPSVGGLPAVVMSAAEVLADGGKEVVGGVTGVIVVVVSNCSGSPTVSDKIIPLKMLISILIAIGSGSAACIVSG